MSNLLKETQTSSFESTLINAGLYKQLAELQGLLQEYRENPDVGGDLRAPIVNCLELTGLERDCPYRAATDTSEAVILDALSCMTVSDEDFSSYATHLYRYAKQQFCSQIYMNRF